MQSPPLKHALGKFNRDLNNDSSWTVDVTDAIDNATVRTRTRARARIRAGNNQKNGLSEVQHDHTSIYEYSSEVAQ